MKRVLILATALLSFSICQSARATSVNLSTGQDVSGNIQTTSGAPDAKWTVLGNPAQVLTTSSNNWFADISGGGLYAWTPDTSASSWIGVTADDIHNGFGPYSYSMTFSLTADELSTASITGAWAIDDKGSLYLNGFLISSLGTTNWLNLNPFSVATGSSDFIAGTNTLTMTMSLSDNNYEGANLAGALDYTSPIPEPGSLLLLGSGMLGMAGMLRRKLLATRR